MILYDVAPLPAPLPPQAQSFPVWLIVVVAAILVTAAIVLIRRAKKKKNG